MLDPGGHVVVDRDVVDGDDDGAQSRWIQVECTCPEVVTGNIVEATVQASTLRRCACTRVTMKTFVVSFSNSATSLLQSLPPQLVEFRTR